MSGHSFQAPQTQALVLVNCQYGRYMIRQRVQNKSNSTFQSQMKELYPAAANDYDWNVFVGELLYQYRNVALKRHRNREAINNQGQQPWVLSSLNGITIPLEDWNRARGFTDREKIRYCLQNMIQVVGSSLKPHTYEGYNQQQNDDPVAVTGGVTHMLNNGPHVINPFEIVCWDVPEPDEPMMSDKTQTMGHTPSMRKLIIVPLREAGRMNSFDVLDWVDGASSELASRNIPIPDPDVVGLGAPEIKVAVGAIRDTHPCNQRDAFIALADLMRMNSATEEEGDAMFLRFFLNMRRSNPVRLQLDATFDDIKRPDREAMERIIGKSLRGGTPGERIDHCWW